MRVYKLEIKLNKEQQALYKLNISACRFVYNLYIQENEKAYKDDRKFISAYSFHKWFNNEYIPLHEEMKWLKEASSKAIKQTILNCESAYRKFFKGLGGKPKFKKSSTDKTGYYFVKNGKNQVIKHERNKVKVPCIGWVTLKEMNYFPQDRIIRSGCITKRVDRYFISLLVDEPFTITEKNKNEGIGIDLGLKEFMTCSNGISFPNINKSLKVKKLEKKLKRIQRALSRKKEAHKKDEDLGWNNYNKNKLQLEKQYMRIENVRNAYINKCIDFLIDLEPKFITLEDLNIKGMRKNKHLAKAISDSKLYYTKQLILQKAKKNGIEVREVNRFYPSSKTCSRCGEINKDLKLKDRTYKCSCGLEIDRDLNASINLREAKEYIILTTGGLPESNDCGVLHQTAVAIQPLAESETEHGEAVKSQFVLNKCIDKRRNLCYNKHVDILQV